MKIICFQTYKHSYRCESGTDIFAMEGHLKLRLQSFMFVVVVVVVVVDNVPEKR